ncbi:dynein light chain Tctex-type protein 2B-like [Physella acuta]|uniref:dynein light chain Tctex-type protein 2B-like n=1 Tax=Physella acuta TaxID=109671 RepID=UPI0027DC80E5|nr:dynein light chain Tctex-type protein 2B-like [Physella acuta]XP_059160714.1 dynein light chain Tctex-type protein 2B-like [Physella acuta]XP_059160715.1 dynein light chain Tctex-type protein 2B-like [Physella acuta]
MSTAQRHPSIAAGRLPAMELSGSARAGMIVTSAQTRDVTTAPLMRHYENTYRLEPKDPVSVSTLKKIIADTLAENLTGRTYSADSGVFAKILAEKIKQKAKDLGIPRYKYVCTVVLGSREHASISMTSRCVWNKDTDTFAEAIYEKDGLYACGVIYGVYTE